MLTGINILFTANTKSKVLSGVCTHMCIGAGQTTSSSAVSEILSTFFWTRSLPDLELDKEAGLAVQQAPGIYPLLPHECGNYNVWHHPSFFIWVLRSEFRSSWLHGKHLPTELTLLPRGAVLLREGKLVTKCPINVGKTQSFQILSQWNDSVGKSTCWKAWWSEFDPLNPCKGRRREPTPSSYPLTTHTNTYLLLFLSYYTFVSLCATICVQESVDPKDNIRTPELNYMQLWSIM